LKCCRRKPHRRQQPAPTRGSRKILAMPCHAAPRPAQPGLAWPRLALPRDELLPVSFDGHEFFMEVGSREGGNRLVVHQFPKKDSPYTENMGRRANDW